MISGLLYVKIDMSPAFLAESRASLLEEVMT